MQNNALNFECLRKSTVTDVFWTFFKLNDLKKGVFMRDFVIKLFIYG